MATGLEKVSFHSNPKEGNAKECSNYHTITLISHALGYLMPIKYYFLISIDQALNGIDLFYSRYYYIILILYCLLPFTMLWKLKKHCLDPFYIP